MQNCIILLSKHQHKVLISTKQINMLYYCTNYLFDMKKIIELLGEDNVFNKTVIQSFSCNTKIKLLTSQKLQNFVEQ